MKTVFLALAVIVSSPLVHADEAEGTKDASEQNLDVQFERKQFVVYRKRGAVYIDAKKVGKHPTVDNRMHVDLIEYFDEKSFGRDRDFFDWTRKLRGGRSYVYDVVKFQDNEEDTEQPLVLIEPELRKKLEPLWQAWVNEQVAKAEKLKRDMEKSQAEARQKMAEKEAADAVAKKVEKAALALAVFSGETSIWEVELQTAGAGCLFSSGTQTTGTSFTASGSGGFSVGAGAIDFVYCNSGNLFVKVYAANSDAAMQNALAKNPGYTVAGIRRLPTAE